MNTLDMCMSNIVVLVETGDGRTSQGTLTIHNSKGFKSRGTVYLIPTF
jgi:hypothetical protein